MTILHIINNLDHGGAERLLIQLARAQQDRGHRVKIVCIAPVGAMAGQAAQMKVPVVTLNAPEGVSLITVLRLAWLIRRENADMVHNHNPRGQIHGSLAARLAGVKNITTRHGNERKSIPSWVWPLTDRVVFISKATEAAFLATEPVKAERCTVIRNGIDLSVFTAEPYVRAGSRKVGIVARLSPEKDIGTLIRAFAILAPQVPDVELLIVGDGGERKMLEALAHNPRIRFLGVRDDIPALMRSFDVFVLASLTEGISLTLLEAMAAAKPIVATNVGGNPEVVVDGETGFLVSPQDPQAMADKILALLNDPTLAAGMGRAGRARVEQYFSLAAMADEYEKVYRMVLG